MTTTLRLVAVAVALNAAEAKSIHLHGLVAALLVAAIPFPRLLAHPVLWGGVALATAVPLVTEPLFAANHHFVSAWVAAGVALALTSRDRFVDDWSHAARWIVIAVLVLAAVQKVLSARFLDGSYLGFMLAKGGFLEPILVHVDAAASFFGRNAALAGRFLASAPGGPQGVVLATFTGLGTFARVAAIVIIVAELGLAAALALRPGAIATRVACLAFIAGVALLRQEYVFATLLTALVGFPPSAGRRSRTVVAGMFATLVVLACAKLV